MNVLVEVLKTDLPAEVNVLACRMEAHGGEVVSNSSKLVLDGAPALPLLAFRFKKASTHAALVFTALNINQEIGSSLYPLTFNSRMVRLLGPLIPAAMAKRPHLTHITTKIPGSEIEKVVGRVWFRIAEYKPTKKPSPPDPNASWMKLDVVQNHFSQLQPTQPSSPNVTALVSRETEILSNAPVPDQTAILSVLFHSVTTKLPELTPGNLLSIACIGSTSDVKEVKIFGSGAGPMHTLSILKAVNVQCDTGTMLELHLASTDGTTLYFSAVCPLSDLLPFKNYNWEFNWRWLPGVTGFSPEESQGNLEPNLAVSVVCWPSLSDYPDYEGLEVFVEGVEFESNLSEVDLVLRCHLAELEERGTGTRRPLYGLCREREEDQDFNAAVIQYSSGNSEQPVTRPAYFFFPSQPNFSTDDSNQILFILYATSHNSCLWWQTESNSTAAIDLTEPLRQLLSQPDNQEGVRWEIASDVITNTSIDALTVHKITGILKWKAPNNKFLSTSTLSMMSRLPLLSDFQARLTGVTTPALDSDVVWKEAVARIGSDVLKLREEIKLLKKENKEYEEYIVNMEASIIVTASEQSKLQHFTKSDLIHKVLEISERLRVEMQASKTSQSKVRALQNKLIQKNDVESRYAELQAAHTAQQKFVRELQTKIAKYKKFIGTCKQQEAVINKLETLVTRDTRDPTGKEALDILTKENARLRAQLSNYQRSGADNWDISDEREKTFDTLKTELGKTQNRCRELEEEVAYLSKCPGVSNATYLGEKDKVEVLERRLEVAAIREQAVIEELKENAGKWAKDKVRQEIQMAELQRPPSGTRRRNRNENKLEKGTVVAAADSGSKLHSHHHHRRQSQTSTPSSASYHQPPPLMSPSMVASPGSRERRGSLPSSPSPISIATFQSTVATPTPTGSHTALHGQSRASVPVQPSHSHTPGYGQSVQASNSRTPGYVQTGQSRASGPLPTSHSRARSKVSNKLTSGRVQTSGQQAAASKRSSLSHSNEPLSPARVPMSTSRATQSHLTIRPKK